MTTDGFRHQDLLLPIKALFRIDSIAGVSGAGLGLAFERLLAKVIPGTNKRQTITLLMMI